MNCTQFQKWLAGQELSGRDDPVPEDLRIHMLECAFCRQEAAAAENLDRLLQEIRTPGQSDELWDSYLLTVVEKARREKDAVRVPALLTWSKRLALPAAALVLMATVYLFNHKTAPDFPQDSATLSMLDFVVEEHQFIMAQQVLDPTSMYSVDEVFLEDWEEPAAPVIRN